VTNAQVSYASFGGTVNNESAYGNVHYIWLNWHQKYETSTQIGCKHLFKRV